MFSSESDLEPEITQEYLESLLTKARNRARAAAAVHEQPQIPLEEDVIALPTEPPKMSAFFRVCARI